MNKITDMNSLLKTWEDLFTRARSDIDALQATVEILKEELETERQISSSLALRCEMISYAITSIQGKLGHPWICLLYTSPSPRDGLLSRMPSSA